LKNFSDIFTTNQLSYLAVLGQSKYNEKDLSNKLQKDVPNEIKQYRFLMHPVRLSIMKALYKNFNLTSVELKNQVDMSWGEYGSHINALESRGFISLHNDFQDGIRVSLVMLEEVGRVEYEALVQLLKGFLEDATYDYFDEKPTEDLYPRNWDDPK
jgi:DNA-binding MarR family transcriptional regulator